MNNKSKFAVGLLAACLLFQIALVILPSSVVAEVRNEIRWIGWPIDWFDRNLPYFSVIHLLSFTLIGLFAHFAFPRASFSKLGGVLLVFAALTESLQLLVPGRSPGVADFIADVVGIVIGLGSASIGARVAGRSGSGRAPDVE